ncbi:MAG: UDP-N-acetylmuramoyl-L-alanyl-D-glutamate--2,6-diaminopimelate ligase [Gammaproteobacteria bacterium]|nr:UDP-N-acetylmuramoyl-L-alanyl-D-glutamate--2,6-diaminopimelate ligase [Gammaproteobacteria bacterium]
MKQHSIIKLQTLLNGDLSVDGIVDCDVSSITMDSRNVQSGSLFLACSGEMSQGHHFIEQAIQMGAVAILYETPVPEGVSEKELNDLSVPVLAFPELSAKAGVIASRFYDDPSTDMTVVGITGTNGKTSCCHFTAQALHDSGLSCGVIGTLGNGIYGSLKSTTHTTPNAIKLQQLLAQMRDQGVSHVIMEVSSHGIQQHRISGVQFDVALFTNLSRDHLDYHGDLVSYANTKKRLFVMPGLRFSVINSDDSVGRELLHELSEKSPGKVKCLSYGLSDVESNVQGYDLALMSSGLTMQVKTPWGQGELNSPLLGRFNASNLLAVLTVLLSLKISLNDAIYRLAHLKAVPGRMESLGGQQGLPLVIVDFAHTPDALMQVLQALRLHCGGTLWCVFGCGGDRDKGKRAEMGAVAEQYADQIVITDDNPRFERAETITENILQGIKSPEQVKVMSDRGEAIHYAISHAAANDMVLIAGKGHENYQLINGEAAPFNDCEQVVAALKEAA